MKFKILKGDTLDRTLPYWPSEPTWDHDFSSKTYDFVILQGDFYPEG